MSIHRLSTVAVAALCATTAHADQLFNENVTVIASQLCVGTACFEDITNMTQGQGIRLRADTPVLLFDDASSTLGGGTNDWLFSTWINGTGFNAFHLRDVTNDTYPVQVVAGAPNSAFVVADNGNIGLGTNLPTSELEIVSNNMPSVTLQQTGLSQSWSLSADHLAMGFINNSDETLPFAVSTGAPDFALFVNDAGNVGLGTGTPGAQLELSSDATFNFFRISATGAAVNDSVDITFTGGPLGTGQLRYNIVDGDNQEMSLDANGNMVLDGTLTTAGPTCAGGCDRVFDADYPLPSIETHAEDMFAKGYLPSIGATIPQAPVNLSERQGAIINSLEHAHIYIDQLHTRLAAQEARDIAQSDLIAELQAEMAALRAAGAQ